MDNYCPVCSSNNPKIIYKNDQYLILRCSDCQFGWLKNSKKISANNRIYKKSYFDNKRTEDFEIDAQRKFKFVKKYFKGDEKILDFGCGLGDFIGVCKKNNIDIYGYDISKYAAKYVIDKYNVPAFSSNLTAKRFKENFFDVIVAFDVIEHVPDFSRVLNYYHRWLKTGGLLILTTPNVDSWDARVLGKYWYGYSKLPQHINYFSPDSIKLVLSRSNFQVKLIKTWGFVRTFNFVLSNMNNIFFAKLLGTILSLSSLDKKAVFFPLVNMIVIAKKI